MTVIDVSESLLVVASVGIQLTTTFASGRQTAMFYDIGSISGIVINEAVTMVKHLFCITASLSLLLVVKRMMHLCILNANHCHVQCLSVHCICTVIQKRWQYICYHNCGKIWIDFYNFGSL